MRQSGYALLLGSLLLGGCDIVSDPVQPSSNGGGPVVEGIPRRVLLEDLTGHRCNNCPRAARVAHDLVDIYGEDLVVVGVHMINGFAAPLQPIGDDLFDTDFRTPAGTTYESTFQVLGLPLGMFNRVPYNNSRTISDGAWAEAMAVMAGQEADLDIQFTSFNYDAGSNTVQGEISVPVVSDITGDHDLVLYLTEDHVIDWQIDAESTPSNVENYEHRHVLRAALNGTWGEPIITGGATTGDTLTATFSYTLPSNVLVPANCALVAYVAQRDTYEVKQVTERKFQP